jgi:hypothetical protein
MRWVSWLLRTWKLMQGSTALMKHTMPSVIPSRSAMDLARSSYIWVRLRVLTWSKEMRGRPDSFARRSTLPAMRFVVALV